jgi:hypothetical protein
MVAAEIPEPPKKKAKEPDCFHGTATNLSVTETAAIEHYWVRAIPEVFDVPAQ